MENMKNTFALMISKNYQKSINFKDYQLQCFI